MRELEREDRVARLRAREVDGHVRLSARVRLDVRVLGAEELLRAVDRELLDLVDDLAAAVVAASRIPLGVLVRGDAADRLEHRRPREVLGRDELDLAALPLELALEERRDLGIDVCEARGAEILERQRRRRHVADATRARTDRRQTPCRRARGRRGTAPSRSTRGSGPVRSSTVDGVPGSSPPSSTAADGGEDLLRNVLEPARDRGRRGGSRSSPRPRRRGRGARPRRLPGRARARRSCRAGSR